MLLNSLFIKKILRIKFVQDVNWLVFSAVLVGVGGIFLQSIVANSLGISALGLYAIVIAIYNVIASGCSMGMDVIALRIAAVYRETCVYHSDEPRRALKTQIGSTLIMVAITSTIVSVVSIVVLSWWPSSIDSHEVDKTFLYLFPTVVIFSMNKLFVSVLMGLRKAFLFAMIRVTRIVLLAVVTGIAIQFSGVSVFHLLLAYPITEVILFLYLLVRFRRDNLVVFDISHLLRNAYFKEGVVISISTLLSELGKYLPLLIAAYFLSLEDAGEVAFILAVSQVMLLVTASISNNVNPIIASRWSKGHLSELESEMCQIYRVTLFSAPFLLAGSVVAYIVITYLVMPERYSELVYIFFTFSMASSLRHALGWPGFMLILIGRSALNAGRLVCTVFVSVLILSVAALQWGVSGLAVAVVFSATAQMIILNAFVKSGSGVGLFDLAKRAMFTPIQ